VPMNDDRCLRDDPALPPALRRDLDRYAQSTAVVYDEEQGLTRLAASLAIVVVSGARGGSCPPADLACDISEHRFGMSTELLRVARLGGGRVCVAHRLFPSVGR